MGPPDISVLTDGTLAGIVSGDTIGLALTAEYADQNVGAGKAVSGPYTLTGMGTDNYTLGSDTFSATANITQASLTITASDASKAYGQTVSFAGTEFTATGLQNGASVGLVTLASSGAAATANVAGSPHAITVSVASGTFNPTNYWITYVNGRLTVIPRGLTVTAYAQSRIYGEANPALTYSLGGLGLVNGDILVGSLLTTATQYSDVGAYAITQGTLLASTNYAMTFLPGVLSVRAANPGPGAQASFVATSTNTSWFMLFLPPPSTTMQTADSGLLTDPRFDATVVCLDSGAGCAALPQQGQP